MERACVASFSLLSSVSLLRLSFILKEFNSSVTPAEHTGVERKRTKVRLVGQAVHIDGFCLCNTDT